MKQNIIAKLGDFTKKLKMNEEMYMKKYKDIVGEDINYNNSNSNRSLDSNSDLTNRNTKKFLETENSNDILMKRDNEINNLVSSIQQLSEIFKDLQTLVIQQGTVLDRIDFNIDNALTSTRNAHKELVKADKNMRSSCARNANMTLILVIFIIATLLIFKFM